MLSGSETDLSDVERYATQFCGSAPAAETDFGGVCLVQAPPAPTPSAASGRLPTCSWLLLRVFLNMLELMLVVWAVLVVLVQQACSAGVKLAGAGGRAAGTGRRAKRAEARVERAEAGSVSFEHDSDVLLSCRVERPSSRVARVNSALHNLCLVHSSSIPAHNAHARMSHARCVVNSVGDTEDGGRLSCVLGGTKSPSTSTRCGVWRPAVDELAHPQQAPLKLHEEAWAGLLQNQGVGISQEVEIVPGCAVSVACPSCPHNPPVSPGPGRVIRNMLGWTLGENRYVWGMVVSWSPPRGESFFFP